MPNGETTLTDADIRALPFMLTTRQAADVCGIGRRTLYDHVERGDLPAHVVGGVYRFNKQEVLVYAGLFWLVDMDYLDGMEDLRRRAYAYSRGAWDTRRPGR